MELIEVGNCKIGAGERCFIVAEAGVNHDGSVSRAMALVDIAKRTGADAVKFQTFKANRLAIANTPKAQYQNRSEGSHLQMIRNLELSYDDFREIKTYCDQSDIIFLSSPFDEESADFLEELNVDAFKIASGEITNHNLLNHIAKKSKPMILSTGMSYLTEVQEAMNAIHRSGNHRIALLHCVSNYPAQPDEVNLRAMKTLANAFNVPVGFSDHTLGYEVPLAAVALGACIIEKHITMDKNLPGPDHSMSLMPEEFEQLVRLIRSIESAFGNGVKEPVPSEFENRMIARRSIVAACSIPAGTIITREMLTLKRPGTGLPPSWLDRLIGGTATVDISEDQLLTAEMIH